MVSCNILPSGGRDIGSYIPRTRRGRLPSTLVIESLNTVAAKTTRTYLYGVQGNLLNFRGRAHADSGAMSGEIPPKLQPESAPSLDAVPVVRSSWQNVSPTRGLTEAVHCTGSGRVRGCESERGPLTLLRKRVGRFSITQLNFPVLKHRPRPPPSNKIFSNPSP